MIFNKTAKRVIAGLSAALILAATGSFSIAANAESAQKLGDVNNDGIINIVDVTVIQKVIAKIKEAPANFDTVADVNCDGIVSIKDATIIQKYIAKIYTELPVKNENPEDTTNAPTEATKATEASAPDTQPATDATNPTEKTTATEATVAPTTEAPTTTAPATQPETDEEGFVHKIFQP